MIVLASRDWGSTDEDVTGESIRRALGEEHVAMERRIEGLHRAVAWSDRAHLAADFVRIERQLRAHLDLEERDLFPKVEVVDAESVALARRDHKRIRALLDELALEVELCRVRASTVETLLTLLRAHAAREDATVYRDADAVLASDARSPVTTRS